MNGKNEWQKIPIFRRFLQSNLTCGFDRVPGSEERRLYHSAILKVG
jgi:hypothetical protein